MTHYDDIYEIAADNFGLITSAEAKAIGITNNELVQYAKRNKIERIGHGVYRLTKHIPSQNDPYAVAVALVGPEAYLYGEAVIGMLQLAPTNPAYLHVATPRRVRKSLPNYIRLVQAKEGEKIAHYDGIPSQSAANAIRSSIGRMIAERLMDATNEARRQGYLNQEECSSLLRDIGERK